MNQESNDQPGGWLDDQPGGWLDDQPGGWLEQQIKKAQEGAWEDTGTGSG